MASLLRPIAKQQKHVFLTRPKATLGKRVNKTSTSQGGFGISNERKRFVEAVLRGPPSSEKTRSPLDLPAFPPPFPPRNNPTTCPHVVHLRVVLGFARSYPIADRFVLILPPASLPLSLPHLSTPRPLSVDVSSRRRNRNARRGGRRKKEEEGTGSIAMRRSVHRSRSLLKVCAGSTTIPVEPSTD